MLMTRPGQRRLPRPWRGSFPLVFVITLLVGCAPFERATPAQHGSPAGAAPVTTTTATAQHTDPPLTPSPTPSPPATARPTPSAVPPEAAQATARPTHDLMVAIDPGHGGIDLGARRFDQDGHMVYHESTVNLELALLVRDELLARGLQVFMTRETDTTVNTEEKDVSGDGVFEYTQDETQARVDLIIASGADLILSIHHNAYEDASGASAAEVGGIQTYYCADRPYSDESLRLATLVHEHLISAIRAYGYDIQDRGVLDDAVLVTPDSPGQHLILLGPASDRIVRPSQVPGTLSEPVFITHAVEGELARDPEFLSALAVAYADAVEAYAEGALPTGAH